MFDQIIKEKAEKVGNELHEKFKMMMVNEIDRVLVYKKDMKIGDLKGIKDSKKAIDDFIIDNSIRAHMDNIVHPIVKK